MCVPVQTTQLLVCICPQIILPVVLLQHPGASFVNFKRAAMFFLDSSGFLTWTLNFPLGINKVAIYLSPMELHSLFSVLRIDRFIIRDVGMCQTFENEIRRTCPLYSHTTTHTHTHTHTHRWDDGLEDGVLCLFISIT